MTIAQNSFYIVAPLIGYLIGSVSFAFLIGRAHGVDIRTVGSKNVGATNLGRALGIRYFWMAFLLDAAKGFCPVLAVALATVWLDAAHPGEIGRWAPLLTAGACVAGHTFPVWLKFRGGKGVATSFGALLGFWPIFTLGALGAVLVFIGVFMVYRYVSLASMAGSVAFTAIVIGLTKLPASPFYLQSRAGGGDSLIIVAALFMVLIVARHRSNIRNLLAGTERRWGERVNKNN